jgi:hypothetical protein
MMFGAAALSADDVWVVGDQESGNGIFETLAEHWDGHAWSVVRTPDPGSSGNHLYAVDAVSSDDVWAVGQQLGAQSPDQGLVEHWSDGKNWSNLYSVAVAHGSVWAVGTFVNPATDNNQVLLLKGTASAWSVVDAPNAGGPGLNDIAGGITTIGGQLWMAGMYTTATSNELPLIEHD